jgi:large subunit ribosomal protein L17
MHNRRVVFSYLQHNDATGELFGPVAEKIGDRPGGYLRVIKTGFRLGDGAEMAMIEFVDFNEVYTTGGADQKSGKTRRSRRGGGSGAAAPAAATAEEE